jgi:hypothetical protein
MKGPVVPEYETGPGSATTMPPGRPPMIDAQLPLK